MAFAVPTYTSLRDKGTQQFVNDTGTQLSPVSGFRSLIKMSAKGLSYGYGYLANIEKQSCPSTATGPYLDGWGQVAGVTRKTPSYATGTVTLTGTPGASVPAGTILMRGDGTTYTTDIATTIGQVQSITCTSLGASGNTAAGTSLAVQIGSLIGVDRAVVAVSAITSGSAAEDDETYRPRVLSALSNRFVGGSANDHVNWALSVNGVVQAWCSEIPLQGGVVVVYIMGDRSNEFKGFPQGSNGTASKETRWPHATGDLLTAADGMWPNRPVTEIMVLCSPIASPIDLTISGMTAATAATQQAVNDALTLFFNLYGSPLGTTITTTQLVQVIEAVPNTSGFVLTSPTESITLTTGQIPTLGTVTYQ
ncbi:baseplate J/gp47 family protein [Gluconobacter sp. DsW_056]|uniref:baseplate J/gp47 family protein n=1 Tax=Gluconobacter sp. DsW_056 TaxID=1511209 RepID=UPI000A372238|nr:baseplate J/gp47 family protein [Gluconobacter sp. DsW_056]